MTPIFRRVCQACFLVIFLPGAYAQQVTPGPDYLQLYRSRDCAQLKTSGAELDELFKRSEAQWNNAGLDNNSDAESRAYGLQLRREGLAGLEKKRETARAAIAMATAEKKCNLPASGAAPSPAPRPLVAQQLVLQATPSVALPAKQAGEGLLPQIGLSVDVVSPSFAQSLGLKQAGGALVLDADAGGPAHKAGLQALDVIVEITGQMVQGPDDLRDTLSRIRPGFKAPLRVWRNKAMRNMVIEVAAGLPVAQTPAMVSPPPAATVQVVVPPPAALPVNAYCYATSFPSPAPGAVSRFFEIPLKNGNYDEALMREKLIDFNTVLLAVKDTRFKPIPLEAINCVRGFSGDIDVCSVNFGGGLFSPLHMSMVVCRTNRAKSEEEWQLNANAHENVDWPVKR